MTTAPPRTILVALELSPQDRPLLDLARHWAQALGAEVVLLHVIPPESDFVGLPRQGEAVRPPAPGEPEVGYAYDRTMKARRAREKHGELETLRAELQAAQVEATALLVEGAYADKILEEAGRLEVGLIVLGTHQRSTLGEWLLGSTSQSVLRRATCPVLVVPHAVQDG